MSPEQRLDLIRRLSVAPWTVKTAQHRSVGRREVEIIILVISAVVLIPWIAYLAVTLPHVYVTHNWDQGWVGFDILLLLLIVATAVLGIFRRQMVMFHRHRSSWPIRGPPPQSLNQWQPGDYGAADNR